MAEKIGATAAAGIIMNGMAPRISFSLHALEQMAERGITPHDVLSVIKEGERIAEYPDDRPYPSALLLGYVDELPHHVVVAEQSGTNSVIIITAYRPDPAIWHEGFRKRK